MPYSSIPVSDSSELNLKKSSLKMLRLSIWTEYCGVTDRNITIQLIQLAYFLLNRLAMVKISMTS